MSLVIPPGFALVSYKFSLIGDPEVMVTTLGIDMDGFAGGQDAADELAGQFLVGFTPADILSDYSFLGTTVAVGQDGGDPVNYLGVPTADGEATLGSALPQNCAFLVQKRSGVAGPQGRGRMYLPPFAAIESEISSNGVLSPGATAAIQGRVNDAFPVDSAVILHDALSPTTVPTPITVLVLSNLLATQRRRLRR